MSRLNEALATPPPEPVRATRIDKIRGELSEKDREAFDASLRNRAWSAEALSRIMKMNGHKISPSTIKHWRRENGI